MIQKNQLNNICIYLNKYFNKSIFSLYFISFLILLVFWQFVIFVSQYKEGKGIYINTLDGQYVNINTKLVNDEFKIIFNDGEFNLLMNFDHNLNLKAQYGIYSIRNDSDLLLGYNEVLRMRNKNKFNNVGDKVNEIFNRNGSIIVGLLPKTNSLIDMSSIVSKKIFNQNIGNSLKLKLDGNTLKYFYQIKKKSDIPEMIKGFIYYKDLETIIADGLKFQPVILGYSEAQTMLSEGLFEKEGDIKEDFFGNKSAIMKILPRTNTIFDNMYFVGSDFIF